MRLRSLAIGVAAVCLAACSSSSNQPLTAALSVTLAGSGGGTVTSSPAGISCGSACSATFNQNSVVTLTATPDASSVFTGWSGSCSGTNASCQVTIGASQSVVATFSPAAAVTHTLLVSLGGNAGGSVNASPIDLSCSGSACSQDYDDGTVVTITATPDTSNFPGATASFTGCDSSTTSTCTVTMSGDRSVGVTFNLPVMHTLTVNIGGTGGGTVTGPGLTCSSATLCTGSYAEGSSVTLTGTPDGSSTVSFSGCNVSGNQCSVTMNANATVNVTFNPIVTHTVSVTVAGDGVITSDLGGINCDSTGGTCTSAAIIDGTTVTLSTTGTNPSVGWTGCDVTTVTTCTIHLTADASIGANINQDVGGLQVAASLQGAHLSWTNPTAAGFPGTTVYVDFGNGPLQVGTANGPSVNSYDIVGLLPGSHYTFIVQSGDSSTAGVSSSATTTFTGTTNDWPATDGVTTYAQALPTVDGNLVTATWNADTLFFSISNAGATVLNNPGNAFWVAIDTDPASDTTGSVASTVVGNNAVIWPFKANYLAELKVTDAQGNSTVTLYDATTGTPVSSTSSTTTGFHGGLDELSVAAADIGLSTVGPVRLAFVAVDTNSGWTYEMAPKYPFATDVLGYHGSVTSNLDVSAHAFDPAQTKISVGSATVNGAPDLVTIATQAAPASGHLVQISSAQAPFDFTPGNAVYALVDDGTQSDGTAGDGIYTGTFNLGGANNAFYFHFADFDTTASTWTDEPNFHAFRDRRHILTGTSEALPSLLWGFAFDSGAGLAVTFEVHSDRAHGTPTNLTGNTAELGNWCSATMPALTDTGTTDANGLEIYTASITFSAGSLNALGFPGTNDLQWKVIHSNPGANNCNNVADAWESAQNHELTFDQLDPMAGPTFFAAFTDNQDQNF